MKNLGTAEIITFKATRYEHPYIESILSLFRGTSTGHIALRLTFSDKALFEKYVHNNNKIPHRIYIDPTDNKPVYEVYVSFWPDGSWSPWHHVSTLRSYSFDCVQSGNFAPVTYNPKMADYIQPLQIVAMSSVPGMKIFGHSIVTIPPTIILHTSRLGIAYGDKQTMTPNYEVMHAAENYAKRYHAWRSTVIDEQNATKLQPNDSSILTEHKRNVKIQKIRLDISRRNLCATMFPDQKLSAQEFETHLEPFVTFGYPERDVVSIPLSKQGNNCGIELEPMLSHINTISMYHNRIPYHVLGNNCARVIFEILWEGCKYSQIKQLTKEFVLPWFIRWFNLTVTPAFIIQQVAKIQATLEKVQAFKLTDQYNQVTNLNQVDNSNKASHIEPKTTSLTFYDQQVREENEDEDELPTTKVGIYAKMIENFAQYIRS